MMEIYYINSEGEKIDFLSEDYSLQTGDLFDYAWEYQSQEDSAISGFQKGIQEKKLTFSFRGSSQKACYENLNRFVAVTERDILVMTPGYLYVGDWYLRCYIVSGEMSDWEMDYGCIDCECALLTDVPVWIHESLQKFRYDYDTIRSVSDLDFPYDFPYDMKKISGSEFLKNDHYAPCEYKMVVYGPCESPRVVINGHPYQVFTDVAQNEYLTIDSKSRAIYRIRSDGTLVNEFNSRQKYPSPSIFEKIPAGTCTVAYTGLNFDVTLYQERSEPVWK